ERFMFRSRVRPEAAAVEQAARWLITSKRPLLVVGDEVWKSGAQTDLVAFAEKFGLPVASGPGGFRNFPSRLKLHLGSFNMSSDYVKAGVDLIVMIGARDFGGRIVPGSPEAPADARIVRIGLDTSHMGRNYPTDLALVADVKEAIKDLRSALQETLAKQRLASFGSARAEQVRYGVPVLTVVWNNHNYQAVRLGFNRYGGKMAATGQYAGMYLGDPEIDFVKLAESQGVKGEKVGTAADLDAALKRGIQATRN